MLGRVRGSLNRVITEGMPLTPDGHGNGHGNGHGDGHGAPAAVTGGEPALEQDGGDGAGGEGHPPGH